MVVSNVVLNFWRNLNVRECNPIIIYIGTYFTSPFAAVTADNKLLREDADSVPQELFEAAEPFPVAVAAVP
jgi:hypothetical protein